MSTPKEAPAFPKRGARARNRSGDYPNDGIKVGPAWRAVWSRLQREGGFVPDADLCREGAAAGQCAEATVRNLLIRAANEEILEKTYVRARGESGALRVRVSYRIARGYR